MGRLITRRGLSAPSPRLFDNTGGDGRYRIGNQPYRGIDHSVGWMIRLAQDGQTHPVVRRWAERVVRKVTPKDYLSETAALYYATAREIRYTRDPEGAEYLQHPVIVLRHRAGDCDDHSMLLRAGRGALDVRRRGTFGAAAQSVGNRIEYVTLGFDKSRPWAHSHVLVRVNMPHLGRSVIIDPVAGPASRQMVQRVAGYKVYPT